MYIRICAQCGTEITDAAACGLCGATSEPQWGPHPAEEGDRVRVEGRGNVQTAFGN